MPWYDRFFEKFWSPACGQLAICHVIQLLLELYHWLHSIVRTTLRQVDYLEVLLQKLFLIPKCYYFIWVINPKLDQNIVELVKNWFKIIPRTICCALFISLMVWWYWFRFSIWNLKVSLKRELANCFSYSDVGDNVMLVTFLWWQFQDIGGRIIMY